MIESRELHCVIEEMAEALWRLAKCGKELPAKDGTLEAENQQLGSQTSRPSEVGATAARNHREGGVTVDKSTEQGKACPLASSVHAFAKTCNAPHAQ